MIHSKERNVIASVLAACSQEAETQELLAPISAPNKRTHLYTGVSIRTIGAIRKEKALAGEGTLISPRKKPLPSKAVEIYSFDRNFIRQTIQKFYLDLKIVKSETTGSYKGKIDFPYG